MTVADKRLLKNIITSVSLDRAHVDQLEEIARGYGISKSETILRLIDLHAGVLLEEVGKIPVPDPFARARWGVRRLTGDLIEEIGGRVRDGSTRHDAYRLAHVTPKQARKWEREGNADREAKQSSLHADLVTTLDVAAAEFNYEMIQEARRKGDFKFLLTRLDPEQFSETHKTDATVRHVLEPLIDWEQLSVTETRTLVELLRKARPQEGDPALSSRARPAAELLPAEILEQVDVDVIEAEWTEAPALEARALEAQKPER